MTRNYATVTPSNQSVDTLNALPTASAKAQMSARPISKRFRRRPLIHPQNAICSIIDINIAPMMIVKLITLSFIASKFGPSVVICCVNLKSRMASGIAITTSNNRSHATSTQRAQAKALTDGGLLRMARECG